MATPERAIQLVNGLEAAGIDFVVSVPDLNIRYVLDELDVRPSIQHVPVNREEEGIGVATGAMLAGRRPAVLMQNGGLLNSCNALTTTALQFGIPMVLLVYYAGDLGDQSFHTLGLVTEPVLQGLGIKYWVMRDPGAVQNVLSRAWTSAEISKRPVALLVTRDVL